MIIIGTGHHFHLLLAKRYGEAIKRVLTNLTGQKIDLQIRVDESLEPKRQEEELAGQGQSGPAENAGAIY